MSEPVIYVNGEFVPQSEARISVMDHAVLYGDGVFETVASWQGRVFKLEAHLDRFARSLAAVCLTAPVDRDQLRALVLEAVRRNDLQNAYVKWIVTRGSNGKPLMDPAGCVPNLIIIARPYIHRFSGKDAATGIRMKTAAIRRPSGQILDPHIKSLNYLNLVLAKLEAKAAGADEALMLDSHGRVCEAPGYNVFLLRRGTLCTPAHDILEGVTRETVMELAAEAGIAVRMCDLELYDTADECFLTSTAGGLIPVGEIDGRRIGDGYAGAMLRKLSDAYAQLLALDRSGTLVYGAAGAA